MEKGWSESRVVEQNRRDAENIAARLRGRAKGERAERWRKVERLLLASFILVATIIIGMHVL